MPRSQRPAMFRSKQLNQLTISLLSLGCAAGLPAQLSWAATPQESPQQLDAVVVTATKVGEVPLQRTPASISVYDQTALGEGNISNIEDLKRQTPGLNVTRNGQATRLYLRGVGTNLDFVGSDPSVTVHVDGVYQSRGYTALDDFLNVERVEVLRGPQGTLYGRNSTGGTINVITRLPDAKPEASVSAEVGNFNMHRATAAASGGLGSEQVIGSLAVTQTEHDPYVENVEPGGEEGLLDDNAKRANASLRTLLGGGSEMILRADYSDENKTTGAYKSTGLGLTGSPTTLGATANIPTDPFETAINVNGPFLEQTSWGDSAEFNIAMAPGWVLTSLTAYRNLDYDTLEDTDGTRLSGLATAVTEKQHQLSQELRVRYTSDTVSWVSGLYISREDHDFEASLFGAATRVILGNNDTRANALFTQASWPLTSSLRATAGVRYSEEEKRFESNSNVILANGTTIQHPVFTYTVDENAVWDDWSPKFTLDYTLTPTTLLYADVSKGFKSGGFNVTSVSAQFDPEEVTAYEIGAKLDWLDNTVRSNIAAFYYDYSDLQVSSFSQPGVLVINNAASAISQGIEIENQWLIGDAWAVDLNYAYLDAKYDKYLTPLPPANTLLVDVSGNHLNASPRHKVTPAIRFYQDSSLGLWSARLEYAWQDKQYFTAFNEDVSGQDDYGLINLMIGLTAPDETWEAQLFGQNLGDEDYSTSSREFVAAATGVTRDINPPRTVSARMTYRFR